MDFCPLCRLGGLRISAECVDPGAELMRRRLVIVEDKMQQGYQYQQYRQHLQLMYVHW